MSAVLPDRPRIDLVVVLVSLLTLPLFFNSLGNTYLWQDEAQTALLGRSVLAHGRPMVGDGAESLSAVRGKDKGIGGTYFQIAWLQAYVAAASLRIFGESSWSARFPFAVTGWLCIPLAAWAMRRAGATRAAARISAVLVALNVPFIIASRQARYYPLAAAFTLLTAGTYAALCDRGGYNRRRTIALSAAFATAASLLVASFDITAIGILPVIALHWVLVRPASGDRGSGAFWTAWGCACLVLAVWLAFSFTAASRHEQAGLGSLPARIRYGAFYYLGQIDAHMVPLPLFLTLGALWPRARAASGTKDAHDNFQAALLFALVALGGIAGATLSPHRFFRYILPVLPVVMGLLAVGLASIWSTGKSGKFVAVALVVALVSTNTLHVWSHAALALMARRSGVVTVRDRSIEHQIPLQRLLNEFRDPPRGPIAAAVDYLRDHAKPRDVIVTTYGDLPLKFHTGLVVYGGETGELPSSNVEVNWIWPRHLTVYDEVRAVAEWIRLELSKGGYQAVELPAVDRRWENREDPEEHIFSNPGPPGPRVVLYKAVE